ncbi:unnamed protein product [Musa acuminata subsp. malaccensis]|uniref:(wild Malaysian banana) hypothetical protein n=1 Tax=Musa acuminata subsp. malaccensis TaxID=214687 RepID=A0A804J1R3_MUSAM|nr:PREDICTED: uncharacterized protein LOC103984149 isoform X1 [Musa acuminata subsp. malaccensis]CAG1837741.1 unnamed protein product [Musa acuminata subsp. malaccensis]
MRDESEEPGEESYNDSHSISEGYDATMTLDLDDEAEKLSYGKTGLLSVSSHNFNLNSFDIEIVEGSSNKQQGGQEVQQRDSRYKVAEEVAHEFEGYGDYTISSLGKNSLEQLETEIEDLVLCSDDVAPLALLLSSKGGALGKENKNSLADGPLGARKPTIGKESEQYFSMLML